MSASSPVGTEPVAAPAAPALSVLDLAPVPDGVGPGDALERSVTLIGLAEDLGFRRYWVAEHHGMPGIASSAPAVLIAHLAAHSHRIRVGSGGVMLTNHVPLVVAEQFGMLASLHPGRIDLGLGRAPGTDPATARALRRPVEATDEDVFPELLGELLRFLDGSWPDGHPYARVRAVPHAPVPPALWLLGSSLYSARLAGLLGMPFSFAHHFSPALTEPAVAMYREAFRPSATLDAPYVALGVAVVAAPEGEEARWLHGPTRLQMLRLRSGRPGALPSPEDAAAFPWTPGERNAAERFTASHIVGDPAAIRTGVASLVAATGADELIVTTNTYRLEDRLRSYRILAEALSPAASPAAR